MTIPVGIPLSLLSRTINVANRKLYTVVLNVSSNTRPRLPYFSSASFPPGKMHAKFYILLSLWKPFHTETESLSFSVVCLLIVKWASFVLMFLKIIRCYVLLCCIQRYMAINKKCLGIPSAKFRNWEGHCCRACQMLNLLWPIYPLNKHVNLAMLLGNLQYIPNR